LSTGLALWNLNNQERAPWENAKKPRKNAYLHEINLKTKIDKV
jgi:hypothetical protein